MGNRSGGTRKPAAAPRQEGSVREAEEQFAVFIRSVRVKDKPVDLKSWKRCKRQIKERIRGLRKKAKPSPAAKRAKPKPNKKP